MCFTNCVTQTTTTIFRENSTKILGCKDAGILYKTHIYVHSNFLSCKMSLVFVFLSLLNFRGRCMFISFFLPSFLCFAISSFNKPTSKSYVEERLWGRKKILNTRDSNVLFTNNFYHQDFFLSWIVCFFRFGSKYIIKRKSKFCMTFEDCKFQESSSQNGIWNTGVHWNGLLLPPSLCARLEYAKIIAWNQSCSFYL